MVFTSDVPNYAAAIMNRDTYGTRIDVDTFHLLLANGFSDPLRPYLNVLPENGINGFASMRLGH